MTNRGRPEKGSDDARRKLIDAAKQCFTNMPYHDVTTRMLAEQAGVNAALIRYYFINKKGLYKEMFISVTGEVMKAVNQALAAKDEFDIEQVFRIFYRIMQKNPTFPLLMFKELVLDQGQCREFLIDRLLRNNQPFIIKVIDQMQRQGILKPNVDLRFLALNFMSMLLFPWHLKGMLQAEMKLPYDQAMLDAMAAHNADILKYGCVKEQTNNEN
ncbi:TetR family transcriptional regulator [Thalassotalea insulae]|uniref:TetR family transcriptional regulator n=1 Tax=Thalassotalea insulae TaxID=2056778 RepID=A0ABQ6GRS9_9GAMM|nr:TetR/AcrR family transcriptional regulator [Thalassotalea insulae]GLX78628.1 TetR family transcriptional regulator [Thalassotalea insulae]